MNENLEEGGRDRRKLDDRSSPVEREKAIPPDRILAAVANDHRRAILDSLTSASERALDYDTLVDRVADRLREEGTEQASDEHRQRVRITLHHTHLPKLKEIRVIDYEAETGHVQFVDGELARDLLTLVESYETYV